jgi:adenylate cyclase
LKPDYRGIFKFQIISWSIAFLLYTLFRITIALDLDELPFFQSGYPPLLLIVINLSAGALLGVLLGFVDIYLIKSIKNKHSFGYFLFRKSLMYIASILLALVFIFGIAIDILDVPLNAAINHFFARTLIGYLGYCLLVSVLIGFIGQINEKFGPGILLPMFLGKYHQPIEEDKVIMFIDLTGSTKFAERLGHAKYSYFIQDFMFDLNVAVNQCAGSIYQYVGDEGVIFWEKKEAIQDLQCISMFFEFQDIIKSKEDYYVDRYGEIPTFKAGANFGRVMVAEVGYLKKEIAFHGDTINIAARIRGLCHQYNEDFIISDNLYRVLNDDPGYIFNNLGKVELKGKENKVELYSVKRSVETGHFK